MKKLSRASLALLVVTVGGCVTMNPSVVDPDVYLGKRENPPGIYRSEATPSLLPLLDVRIDPMDRLFLVNIANDPVYEGVELQTFPREGGDPHVRVLLWRSDTVDVYDSPGRVFDQDQDRRGLESLLSPRAVTVQEGSFEYRFETTPHGLDAALRMRDREGREVVVEVVETRGEPIRGGLIAPVGATSAAPDYLPLFFLDEFALVKRGGTRVAISVGGQPRAPAKMTRLMKGPASYFSRYSDRVVIAHLNERRDADLEPVTLEAGADVVEAGGVEWRIVWNGPRPEAIAAVARSRDDVLTFRFAPALPDVLALRPGARVTGRFVVNVNDIPGVVAGEYEIARGEETAHLVLQPVDAWQPPMVRGPSWVASYRYEAEIDLHGPAPRLRSRWLRQDPHAIPPVAAGHQEAEPAAAAPDGKRHGVYPIPVVYYTPETRWAGGAAGFHSFRRGPGGRPTVSGASVVYTQNDQFSAELRTDAFLADGRYSVSFEGIHSRFPDRFFGIGNATLAADEELYTPRTTRGRLDVRRRVWPGLYVGGVLEARDTEMLAVEEGRRLASGSVPGSTGGQARGGGASLTRDTRDNVLFPTTGSYHSASAVKLGGAFGGDFDLARYAVDLRRYVPLRPGHVVGVHGLLRSTTGDVPFELMPRLGGAGIMRGTHQGRYRDQHMVAAQVEYRLHIWRRIGAAGFVGGGQVAPSLDAIRLADLHPTFGAGLRFALDPRERMNLRLDFGYGSDGATGMYITAGEAF